MTLNSRLFGLIGYSLEHSFSVPYFSEKFSKEDIGAEYRNFPLESIEGFRTLLDREPGLEGLNVTVPYKEQVIPFLDELDETALAVGAVNTITIIRQNSLDKNLRLRGSNTDVTGFMQSLEEHREVGHDRALVLGTGGSSRAVVHVLDKLRIPYMLVSRKRGDGRRAYNDLDRTMVRMHPLIINTTPVGMYPGVNACPAIPYEGIGPGHLLFDLIYNPARTLFLKKGEAQGASFVNGYDMLVYQAEASWKIWNQPKNQVI